MVPDGRVVAGQTEDISDAQQVRPQQIRLDRQPVPVPAGDLHHRIMAHLIEEPADRQRARPHDGGGVVGHVDTVNASDQAFGVVEQSRRIRTLGWVVFDRDGEAVPVEDLFQAPRTVAHTPSYRMVDG